MIDTIDTAVLSQARDCRYHSNPAKRLTADKVRQSIESA
jgi:hypothetical protein